MVSADFQYEFRFGRSDLHSPLPEMLYDKISIITFADLFQIHELRALIKRICAVGKNGFKSSSVAALEYKIYVFIFLNRRPQICFRILIRKASYLLEFINCYQSSFTALLKKIKYLL